MSPNDKAALGRFKTLAEQPQPPALANDNASAEHAALARLRAAMRAEFEAFDDCARAMIVAIAGVQTAAIEVLQSGQRLRAELQTAALQAEIAAADQAGAR